MAEDKVFNVQSKQIKRKEKPKTLDRRSAEQELNDIRLMNDKEMSSISKLSGSLRKTLNTAKVALPKTNDIERVDDSSVFKVIGKVKSKEEAEAVLMSKIEETTSRVSLYNHTGVYAKMLEARRNNFIEDNLPRTRTSLDLYVDDVNNGAFRGSEYGNHNKFRFYENGALVTDMNKIEKMSEYLNPTSFFKLSDDVKSFDDIDARSDYLSYKHGNSVTRLVSHKDVAKDMYIKYVMKEAKRKTVGNNFRKEKAIVVNNPSALESINDFISNEFNISPLKPEDNLLQCVGEDIIAMIPSDFYHYEDRYVGEVTIGMESGQPITQQVLVDNFTYNEITKEETFLEFAERYLYGGCSRVYNVNPKENRDKVIDGYCFTFETESISNEAANAVMSELLKNSLKNTAVFGNESIDIGIESFINTDKAFVSNALRAISFEQIYNTSANRIASYNDLTNQLPSNGTGFESRITVPDNYMLRAVGSNTVDKLYLRCFNLLNRNIEIGLEDYTSTPINSSRADVLGGFALGDKKDALNTGGSGFNSSADDKVRDKRINYNKLEKMFGNIKGCTIEYLDNTRKIDLIAGNKKIGCYYIEYTHQDIQHFIGLRTILGNPTYSQTVDVTNVRNDEQEETLGRLIFSDTIKPLIEANIDTKFIRNNSDIIYCLQKLMEENELSQSMSYSDLSRFSMYNLSKIIFIPANQCVYKKNGDGPMGESRFAQAVVPATSHILAKEAYLSWILCDAKGISFLTIPKGMSELGGEYGQDHLKDRIDELNVSRAKLRDIAFNNTPLTHRFVVLQKGEESEDIGINTIEYPDFNIDDNVMKQWESEYTSIIGMSSELFAGDSSPELAKKLFELDDAQLMRVIGSRSQKKIPSSQLATRLLQLRGGEEFNSISVEWVEPSINVNNYGRRSDIVDELNKTVETYMATYDSVYEDSDEEYKAIRPYIVRELLERLTDTDSLLTGMNDIYTSARAKMLVYVTEQVEEAAADAEKEKEAKKAEKEKEKNTDEESEEA